MSSTDEKRLANFAATTQALYLDHTLYDAFRRGFRRRAMSLLTRNNGQPVPGLVIASDTSLVETNRNVFDGTYQNGDNGLCEPPYDGAFYGDDVLSHDTWIGVDFDAPVCARSYQIFIPNNDVLTPADFSLQASNDGAGWDTLDEKNSFDAYYDYIAQDRTGHTDGGYSESGVLASQRLYFANETFYKMYRLLLERGGGNPSSSYAGILELHIYSGDEE